MENGMTSRQRDRDGYDNEHWFLDCKDIDRHGCLNHGVTFAWNHAMSAKLSFPWRRDYRVETDFVLFGLREKDPPAPRNPSDG